MTARQRLGRVLGAYEGRPVRRGIIAAAVVVMLGLGVGAASAYWTTSVTATSTASAAQLALSTANFTTNAYTFGNENLTTTGSVTVTNTSSTTSTRVPALTLALSRLSGNAGLASDINVTMWYQANGTCTASTAVGSGSVTGTWASFPGLTSTLAKAAAATYCIRSTISDRQDAALAGGTATFVPQISATLSVGNFTATATASASAGQTTQYIYPLTSASPSTWYTVRSSGQCMDVNGGGTSNTGTTIISYPCHSAENQQWQFVQDGTTGYYDIKPRSGITTSVRADINSQTTSGSGLTVRTDSATAGQLWQPQLITGSTFQLVNKLTGLCMTSTTQNAGQITQVTCNGSTAQQITLTGVEDVVLSDVTCTTTGFGTGRRVRFDWDLGEAGGYTIQAQRFSTWYTVSTPTAATATSSAVTGSLPTGNAPLSWTNGTYNVRILDVEGNTVGTDTFTVGGTSPSRYLTC